MDNSVLIGADAVERAGYQLVTAAADIVRAAASMVEAAEKMRKSQSDLDYTLSNHQRFLNDWLARLHGTLQECIPPSGEPIDVRIVETEEDEEERHHESATIPSSPPDDSDDVENWKGTMD